MYSLNSYIYLSMLHSSFLRWSFYFRRSIKSLSSSSFCSSNSSFWILSWMSSLSFSICYLSYSLVSSRYFNLAEWSTNALPICSHSLFSSFDCAFNSLFCYFRFFFFSFTKLSYSTISSFNWCILLILLSLKYMYSLSSIIWLDT